MSLINCASLEVSDLSIALKAVPMRVLWSYVLMDCGVEFVMKGWDYRDAIVTCNQLGLPSYGIITNYCLHT